MNQIANKLYVGKGSEFYNRSMKSPDYNLGQ